MVSSTHKVCADNIYVAIVSTIVETSVPENEIQPGLQLLGTIYEKYALSLPFLSYIYTTNLIDS
jgi:Rab GDP dissociation inhibitor